MCAETKGEKPKRRYKQRKSKYSSELWDDMPLHKEPKTKRSENEAEIVANYRAMMNKPKRKYKQRKSKYDSNLWSSLPLHRDPKRVTEDDETGKTSDENNEDSEQNDSKCDRMYSPTRNNNSQTIGDHQNDKIGKGSDSIESRDIRQHGDVRQHGKGRQIMKSAQMTCDTSANTNNQRSKTQMAITSDTAVKEFSDTLFVQKVLGFLLKEQDSISKKNVIGMFKMDKKLNSICLNEISRRCGSLRSLNDTNISHVVKEHVFLMKLYKYLSKYQVSKSQNGSNLEADRKTTGDRFSLDSEGNEDCDIMRSNSHNIIEPCDNREHAHKKPVSNDLNVVENMKHHLFAPNDGCARDKKSENGSTEQLQEHISEGPFPVSTWMDVSQALSPLPLASFVSEFIDDDELFCEDVIRDGHFLESMDVDDTNTNEILRLAAVISNPI